MKKIALWGIAALSLGFTACDDYETPNPPAQSNPADATIDATNLVYSESEADKAVIDLKQLDYEGFQADVAIVNLTSELPARYTLKNVMQVSASADYSNPADVQTTSTLLENGDFSVSVTPKDLQYAINQVVSKNPVEQTIHVRFAAYAVNGESSMRFGGPDYYYGDYTLKIAPIPPQYVISEAYYLIGTVSDGSVATAVKFSHTDTNVYDDPMFTVKVDISEEQANDGWQWMIISEEAFEAGNTDTPGTLFGQENEYDDYTEGTLFASTADFTPGYGVVYDFGPYLIKFNAETLGYSFMQAIETIYVPGNAQGWSPATADQLTTTDYVNYQGFAHLNGEFKFTGQPDWDPLNWGAGATNDELSMGSQTNLQAPADALYWVTFNLGGPTYKITEIQTLGLIGGFNDWGSQLNLTPSADFLVWTGTVTIAQQCEYKIRMNDNWDLNLGDDPDNLVFNAAFNLQSPAAGTYTVTVDLSKHPYTIKFN